MPSWIADDWIVAAVASLIVLGVCLAVGVVYGAIWGLAATSEPGGLVSGALTGAYLPFAMFGVETTAVRLADDASFGYLLRTLPLPLLLVPLAGMYGAIRFAWPRVVRRPPNLIAFVAKVALFVTLAATVLASLLSIGEIDPLRGEVFGGSRSGFASEVSAGTAALYPFIILVIAGLGLLAWRRVPIAGGRVNRALDSEVGRSLAWGAVAFLAVSLVLAVVVLLADVVVADDGEKRLSALVGFFATGINRGIAASVLAMGGAVERLGSHTSLFHWGTYESPGQGNAPFPLFLLLAIAPLALGFVTLRRLDRELPADEQGVVRNAASIAAGFVLTSWILALLTREDLVAAGSPRGAFGLGLLWALVACGAAAVVWSQRNGVRWNALQPREAPDFVEDESWQPTESWDAPSSPPDYQDPAPAPAASTETWAPAPPPPVAARRPRAVKTCQECGAASDGSRFCRTCGVEVG